MNISNRFENIDIEKKNCLAIIAPNNQTYLHLCDLYNDLIKYNNSQIEFD